MYLSSKFPRKGIFPCFHLQSLQICMSVRMCVWLCTWVYIAHLATSAHPYPLVPSSHLGAHHLWRMAVAYFHFLCLFAWVQLYSSVTVTFHLISHTLSFGLWINITQFICYTCKYCIIFTVCLAWCTIWLIATPSTIGSFKIMDAVASYRTPFRSC